VRFRLLRDAFKSDNANRTNKENNDDENRT